jgi:hypothetical protein
MSDQAELKKVLHYDPATGIFTWVDGQTGRGTHYRKGIAGWISVKGYRYIRLNGRTCFAHRLAWLYMTGAHPTDQIDHKNGLRDDNRWDNLREANNGQNMQNIAGPHGKTRVGVLGVTFRRGVFEARIQHEKRRVHLGTFGTKEEADEAYRAAKLKTHSFSERPVINAGA